MKLTLEPQSSPKQHRAAAPALSDVKLPAGFTRWIDVCARDHRESVQHTSSQQTHAKPWAMPEQSARRLAPDFITKPTTHPQLTMIVLTACRMQLGSPSPALICCRPGSWTRSTPAAFQRCEMRGRCAADVQLWRQATSPQMPLFSGCLCLATGDLNISGNWVRAVTWNFTRPPRLA